MNLSFQEKSLWVSLVSTVLIFGYYFVYSFQILLDANEANNAGIFGLFVGMLVVFIVIQIVLHIIITIFSRRQDSDERDRLIELKGTRIAYYALVIGIWTSFSVPLFWAHSMMSAHFILLSFIVAVVASYVAQLIYYRRGM